MIILEELDNEQNLLIKRWRHDMSMAKYFCDFFSQNGTIYLHGTICPHFSSSQNSTIYICMAQYVRKFFLKKRHDMSGSFFSKTARQSTHNVPCGHVMPFLIKQIADILCHGHIVPPQVPLSLHLSTFSGMDISHIRPWCHQYLVPLIA